MNEIPKIFSLVKMIMVLVTFVVTGLTIWGIYSVFEWADRERDAIYVVDSRNTLKLALAENVSVNRVAEAEAHVKRLHELIFVLSPNSEFIQHNLDLLQNLSGNSVKNYCNSLRESGFYNSLVANGISTEFMCDSIVVREDANYDFKVFLWGKTSLISSEKIVFKSLMTACYLRSCGRDEWNPQGFMVEDWKVIKQEELGAVERTPYEPEVSRDTISKQ